jgi:iron complex outermembrane receptor protein
MLATLALGSAGPLGAQKADLSGATLEQLTQIQISVSSFARKEEDLWKTPAAVYVITHEDIARSAATSIPELLRGVPGLQVAQINASTWAISARGFNSAYSDKLLVLIDGRTVYSEVFAGALWDQIDLPLDDIERIEIIRGPGAAVWGTNAVNGVVNIITKRTRSTMGLRSSGSVGRINESTFLRYGGTLGRRAQYRGYAGYVNREPFELPSGKPAFDGEDTVRAGGRLDWQRSGSDWITTSGDLYGGHLKDQFRPDITLPVGPNGQAHDSISGGYLLSRWEHKAAASDSAAQVYFDDQSRRELAADVRSRTSDIDVQDHIALGRRNDLVAGAELRYTSDHVAGNSLPVIRPNYRDYLADGFVQDEIQIVPQHLTATLGSKIQDGTLAGFQVQPSARLLWAPDVQQSIWIAISRAAVAPAIQDRYVRIPLNLGTTEGLPFTAIFEGNPAIKPEEVIAYEAGYRRKLPRSVTFDLATFYNVNDRIQSFSEIGPALIPAPEPHLALQFIYGNGYRARTGGFEASLAWKPGTTVAFQANYTWMQAHTAQTEPGTSVITDSWSSPRNTASGTASWRFATNFSANTFVSYIGSYPALFLEGGSEIVPAYTRFDLHVAYKLAHSIELDAGGTNLLTPRHIEFGSGSTAVVLPSYVPRSLFIRGKWSF